MLFGREHVDRYVATDGEEGYTWREGTEILILTTKGRKSGELRSTPLIFGRHGDDYLVVGSRGGAPKAPAWYGNLVADPEVQVQIKGDRFPAHARTATAEEKPDLWKTMTAVWPHYDEYQQRTEREIPVVILTRD
ncbi:MAG TPA: nitroreductase family deazaflavin-dependent oxidoreductase [Candidatus Dormibacteraeota bacterium]|jgi:deazaflavin-dependent oxidoreductase (nitroreductase family)|nr:nitroreductase family deazaflavin-dependent oxidoreductase [Candidatus Dormibacteraeota bacterium]